MKFSVLSSSSSGNCTYIETDEGAVLVDVGLSGKKIEAHLSSLGRSMENVRALLITHEHSDHVLGLGVLAKRYGVPVYATEATIMELKRQQSANFTWKSMPDDQCVEIAGMRIDCFSVPHDAYAPVAYRFFTAECSLGVVMDLGHATRLVQQKAGECETLLLEANYDLALLRADSKRPWEVKQRIQARHGHLSNEAAGELARTLSQAKLRHLFLGHLSSDCNTPQRAKEVVEAQLKGTDVTVYNTHPKEPTGLFDCQKGSFVVERCAENVVTL
jgi:phosphoribosyl 1,2-cyclic phosphodiesterase